jgi:hypothetical protein
MSGPTTPPIQRLQAYAYRRFGRCRFSSLRWISAPASRLKKREYLQGVGSIASRIVGCECCRSDRVADRPSALRVEAPLRRGQGTRLASAVRVGEILPDRRTPEPLLRWRPPRNFRSNSSCRRAGWYFNDDSREASAPPSKSPSYPTQIVRPSQLPWVRGSAPTSARPRLGPLGCRRLGPGLWWHRPGW